MDVFGGGSQGPPLFIDPYGSPPAVIRAGVALERRRAGPEFSLLANRFGDNDLEPL